ncbi:MAG: type II toxin-antitoxin system PemK/MazF family toxin [Kouleothrix sp.]|nr:type II toxin-antitoxin system PemK/MazF family toxin [Kouleothrix sp.]
MAREPSRGEIWTANLDPIKGHEQAGQRPVLIVSTNGFNHGPADMIIVAPLTRTAKHIPYRVQVDPPEGGVSDRSYVLCDSIRAISKERLDTRRGAWGSVAPATLAQVEDYLRILLEL